MKNPKYLKLFLFMGLIPCLAVFSGTTGCSTKRVLTEGITTPREWQCDKEADEALKGRDYITSIKLHERFIEDSPFNGLAFYHLGYAYGQMGNHEKEVSLYEKAISLGFTENNIFFNLGMAYGELDHMEKAIDTFKRGLAADRENFDNHFGLALAYQRNLSFKLAEEEFLKAIEIKPEDIDARFYLGMMYADMGKYREAREQALKIQESDKDNEMAIEILNRIDGG